MNRPIFVVEWHLLRPARPVLLRPFHDEETRPLLTLLPNAVLSRPCPSRPLVFHQESEPAGFDQMFDHSRPKRPCVRAKWPGPVQAARQPLQKQVRSGLCEKKWR